MTSTGFLAAQIPMTALLLLGTQAQAEMVANSADLGSTLLMLEHQYGCLSLIDHFELTGRLAELKALFKNRVTEMSGPLTKMHSLNFFFERVPLLPKAESRCPSLLSDLLMNRPKQLVPSHISPALIGLTAHLGGLLGLQLVIGSTSEGNQGIFSLAEGLLLTFERNRPELVVTPEMPESAPLISVVARYLHAMAESLSEDADHSRRLIAASREIYPGTSSVV